MKSLPRAMSFQGLSSSTCTAETLAFCGYLNNGNVYTVIMTHSPENYLQSVLIVSEIGGVSSNTSKLIVKEPLKVRAVVY